MKLIRTFSKIMIVRNHNDYIRMISSIVIAYIVIAFTGIYIDGILAVQPVTGYSEQRYIIISTLTVLIIAAVTTVIYQLYTVMLSGMKDYMILRRLGATNLHIRILNMIQGLFLLIVSVPIGLFCGYLLTTGLVNYARSLIQSPFLMQRITSAYTLLILAGIIFLIIISIGIYLDRKISRISLSYSRLGISSGCEEIRYGNM